MIIIDTDAISHMIKRNGLGEQIRGNLDRSPDREVRIRSVTAYEILGGAADKVDKCSRNPKLDLVSAYRLLDSVTKYLADWAGGMVPYTVQAHEVYRAFPARLRQELGDDTRIAATALVNVAEVWTCNVRHFLMVPGLIVVDASTGQRVNRSAEPAG